MAKKTKAVEKAATRGVEMRVLRLFNTTKDLRKAFNSKLKTLRRLGKVYNHKVTAVHPTRTLRVTTEAGEEVVFIFRTIYLSFDLDSLRGMICDEVWAGDIEDKIKLLQSELQMLKIKSRLLEEQNNQDFKA